MKKKLIFLSFFILIIFFILTFLLSISNPFLLKAQQINPPKLLKIIVTNGCGDPIHQAAISIDFKPIGLTNFNGEFCFENNGGTLAISKPGYTIKLMELPIYWQGDIKITLFKSEEYQIDSKVNNYKRKIYLNGAPLINQKVLIVNNDSYYSFTNTDSEGFLNIFFEKKSKNYLFYIQEKQNSIYLFFSKLKEEDNDSILVLDYNVVKTYHIDIKNKIIADEIILKSKNQFLKIPIYLKTKVLSPYKIYVGSNEYEFFENYEIFLHFYLNITDLAKITNVSINNFIGNNVSLKDTLLSYMIKLDSKNEISDLDFKNIFEKKINISIKNSLIEKIFLLLRFYFVNNDYLEFWIEDNDMINLSKLKIYDNNSKLLLQAYLFNNLKIPKLYFEKEFSIIVEMYPNVFYDNLINDTNLLSNDSYFGFEFKIWEINH